MAPSKPLLALHCSVLLMGWSSTCTLRAERMYWTDRAANTIRRANLDGSDVETLVSGQGELRGMELDLLHGKMYWANNGVDRIQRANLDGTNVENLVTTGLQFPAGTTVDAVDGKVYWADQDTRRVQRANLDGSGVQTIFQGTASARPYFVALDLLSDKVYWTDWGQRTIRRANLDGTGAQDLVTIGASSSLLRGIALDVNAGKMYWTDRGTDSIQRANLDGSGVEDILTGAPYLAAPWQIVLDLTSIPGDVNRDGTVDRGDLAQLIRHYGIQKAALWTDGDLNHDDAVTLADLSILQSHFGDAVGPDPTAVPEPSGWHLVMLAVVIAFAWKARWPPAGRPGIVW